MKGKQMKVKELIEKLQQMPQDSELDCRCYVDSVSWSGFQPTDTFELIETTVPTVVISMEDW